MDECREVWDSYAWMNVGKPWTVMHILMQGNLAWSCMAESREILDG